MNRKIIFFLISFVLVIGAMAAGYYEANSIAESITQDASDRIKQKEEQLLKKELKDSEALGENPDEAEAADTIEDAAPELKLSELICSIDGITGEVEDIVLHITDCVGKQIVFIYLEPECDYTMSQGLYGNLANGNVLLPQTVRLSKLPQYYGENGSEKAMRSMKRIVSELLAIDIDYYTLLSKPEFYSMFSVKTGNVQDKLCLTETKKQIYEKSGSGDSCRGYVEKVFGTSLTDFEMDKRLLYVDVWNEMDAENVLYGNVKINEKNESMSAELDGGLERLLEFGR